MDSQTKRLNSTIKAYFQAFVNFKQNNWVQFLPQADFAYNNTKNVSTGHILFELNCGYYFWITYKENFYPCSWSKIAEELSYELQNLMATYHQNLHYAK